MKRGLRDLYAVDPAPSDAGARRAQLDAVFADCNFQLCLILFGLCPAGVAAAARHHAVLVKIELWLSKIEFNSPLVGKLQAIYDLGAQ
jgi:hypothetical protein